MGNKQEEIKKKVDAVQKRNEKKMSKLSQK